ncbi:MAG TPA: ROK family protein [Chloroflexota bacterium]|nr:ROK family protein [Chloroflexota bacterium]
MGLWGGIEAGGTKFVCMIGRGPQDIHAEERFPTTTPRETLLHAATFFRQHSSPQTPLEGIGVASFGPVDLDPKSLTYGHTTSTPKPGWAGTNVVGMLVQELGVPVAFDTDVNCAAYGEYKWGAARGLDSVIYITVGTGIGGGVVMNGKPVHGLVHPEIGHMLIPHDRQSDPYPGWCPYHRDCLEGLAAGPSLKGRWGQPGNLLPEGHPAWELEAHYLGLALANLILCHSPHRIVMGGGVMDQSFLLPLLRKKVQQSLNGYVQSPQILDEIDRYIVAPVLGNKAGVLGAIALAQDLLARPTPV